MCARYGFSEVQAEEILQIVKAIERGYGDGAWKPGEIHPTDKAPVVISDAGKRVPQLYTWGYKTVEKPIINARSETAESLDIFRSSVEKQRCAVPCTCFYEWDRTKRKHRFTLPGSDFFYMAAIYTLWDGELCYCILTTQANASVGKIHRRMPIVLSSDSITPWLESRDAAQKILHSTPPALAAERVEAQMTLW